MSVIKKNIPQKQVLPEMNSRYRVYYDYKEIIQKHGASSPEVKTALTKYAKELGVSEHEFAGLIHTFFYS